MANASGNQIAFNLCCDTGHNAEFLLTKKQKIDTIKKLLKYEKERNEINDLRLLITHEKPFMRCLFSSVYWSDSSMKNELKRIQEKIDEITEEPVFSSGHAFVCIKPVNLS